MRPFPRRPSSWLVLVGVIAALGGCRDRVVDAIRGPTAIDAGLQADVDGPADAPDAQTPDVAVLPPPDGAPAQDGDQPLPRSCNEVRAGDPAARGGVYTLDPDGPGGQPPFSTFCDMVTNGGGWTRLAHEDFEGGSARFSVNTVTTCGAFGNILGGHGVLSNDTVTATFDLRGVPHAEVRVSFDFIVLDSWDHEEAFAELDGQRLWTRRCDKGAPQTCNQVSDQCGWAGADRNDGKLAVELLAPHVAATVTLRVGAVLNQGPIDESWGLDNVSVFVR